MGRNRFDDRKESEKMKRCSVSLLRNLVHGTGRSRPVAVSGFSATNKTLKPSSPPTTKPFSDSTFSTRSTFSVPSLHARSYSYYSLQDQTDMEEHWRQLSRQYQDGAEEETKVVDPPNLIIINSEDEFKSYLSKVKDESLPAVFYYTSLSSAPCRVVLPMVRELGKKFPHITTYKIDIDQEGVQSTLEEFNVTVVPHLNFFLRGKKVTELIGPEVKELMETLQKLCSYYCGMKEIYDEDSAGKSITESAEESVPESAGESMAESAGESMAESAGESMEESTGESTK